MSRNMITIKNVIKNYGAVKALDNITFSLERGKEVAIMGPSGSGKTTLINLIAGLDSPSVGKITINGYILNDLNSEKLATFRRENIGIIFNSFT